MCPDCLKRFESAEKLETHNKWKSKLCPRFACTDCGERFCTKRMLDKHKKNHDAFDQEVPEVQNVHTVSCEVNADVIEQIENPEEISFIFV